MVHLNRITTKAGDAGMTSLGDGSRVSKTDPRVAAIGSVDETNSAIGFALAGASGSQQIAQVLRQLQHDLFDAGAELCFPPSKDSSPEAEDRLRITAAYVSRLERHADDANAQLSALDSFVLPGGCELAARLHLARAVSRRAERDVLLLAESGHVGLELCRYLNRLSDLLFLLARLANDAGLNDVLWQPGSSRNPDESTGPHPGAS